MSKTTKSKILTVDDIVCPGAILDLARNTLSHIHDITGLVVIIKDKNECSNMAYAGLTEYEAIGLVQHAITSLVLEDKTNEEDY